ncbi:MAG: hypothetical protein AABW80_02005 [Nanoarchaeota archaeon]
MRLTSILTLTFLLIASNSCQIPLPKKQVTFFPGDYCSRTTLAHLLLDSERYAKTYHPKEEDYLTLDKFLKETKKVSPKNPYSEEEARRAILEINRAIRENCLKELIVPNEEAVKVTLFTQGIQQKKGHCFHHTALYASIAQTHNLPLSVYHAPQFTTPQDGTNKIHYGHVFMRWNFPNQISNGANYFIFEPITGLTQPLDYCRKVEGMERRIEHFSLNRFTDWAVNSRLIFCSSELGDRKGIAEKEISASLQRFFGSKIGESPTSSEPELLYQKNGGKF